MMNLKESFLIFQGENSYPTLIMHKTLLLGLIFVFSGRGLAETAVNENFYHNDWQLVCDNTRTCRAAGYQADEDSLSLSALLTRKAGPGEKVSGELRLGELDSPPIENLPKTISLQLDISGKPFGKVAVDSNGDSALHAELSDSQTEALVKSLAKSSHITFSADGRVWHLSDKGAAAVLLKMDEFQGRINTQTALIKKGTQSDAKVLPALPVPVVSKAKVDSASGAKQVLSESERNALQKTLLASIKDDDCSIPAEQGNPSEQSEPELSVARLNGKKLLVSLLCWRGAYNEGFGYWVVNQSKPYGPVLVTTSGTDYSDGLISSFQKGRGIGDCISTEQWVWDGKVFVQTASATTGLCKAVAAGGAWELPTLVTDVRKQ